MKIACICLLLCVVGCGTPNCVTRANRSVERNARLGNDSGVIVYHPWGAKYLHAIVWITDDQGNQLNYDPKTGRIVSDREIGSPWVITRGPWARGTLPKWGR